MRYLVQDPATKGMVGIFHFPEVSGPQQEKLFYLQKHLTEEEKEYSSDEVWFSRKEKEIFTFTFYCDSVAGGNDHSGTGTKEDPCRNLQDLLDKIACDATYNFLPNLFGSRNGRICKFFSIFSLNFRIKIFLKGIVDYEVDFLKYPSLSGVRGTLLFKNAKFFIFDGWGEEGGFFQGINDLSLTNTCFRNIHFRNVDAMGVSACSFENSSFSDVKYFYVPRGELYDHGDFYRCKFRNSDMAPWVFKFRMKECEIIFEEGYTGSEACSVTGELEDCTISAKTPAKLSPYGLTLFGSFKGMNIFTCMDMSSYYQGLEMTFSSIRLFGVMADSRIRISAKKDMPPIPPEVPENQRDEFNQFHVYGISGEYNTLCIRCSVINDGISGENVNPLFCGFCSGMRLMECSAASDSSFGYECEL